jgi:hypothetical protein
LSATGLYDTHAAVVPASDGEFDAILSDQWNALGGSHMIGGYHDEDFEIWDSAGQLVAQARQLALLPEAAQAA